ncbi:unnamed protein product [Rotaria sp. Silwood1]|nr:unnamed protein product [Rotaria sp. Silwood1]
MDYSEKPLLSNKKSATTSKSIVNQRRTVKRSVRNCFGLRNRCTNKSDHISMESIVDNQYMKTNNIPIDPNEDTLLIIWLDPDIDASEYQEKCNHLTKSLKIFTEHKSCEAYIQHLVVDQEFILFVAISISHIIIPCVHNLTQLIVIYVYSSDQRDKENIYPMYWKVQHKYIAKMDDLLPIFRYEQSQYHEHLDKRQFLNIYKSEGYIRAINEIESNDRFIWMYNFAIIFFHMDPVLSTVTAEHEKEELIIKLRTLYSYDIEALNEIEDFNKDYNTENPIKSYDKMKSIREILNKALRQKDFELIGLFRFFIFDLFEQIKSNYRMTHRNERTDDSCQTFYGTKLIPFNQIEEIINSKRHLVSINVFWSMSLDDNNTTAPLTRPVTPMLSRDFRIVHFTVKMLQSFHMEHENFQAIDNLYYYQSENRILFPPGTIFKIIHRSISHQDENLYYIQLELAPFNIISDFDEIVQFWISNENLKTNQISLGLMMIQTGKLNEAKKYYESLIKYLPDNHPLEKYCKYSLGNLAQKKGEIDDAEKYYNEAFENQVDTLLRARVTCALANIYFSKNDKSKAFEYYKLALSMFNKNHKDFILDIIECYTGIGKYYQTSQIDKDYEKALKSFTNAINELDNWISKNIRKQWRYVPFIIIPLLKNIREIFRLKHEFNKAYACEYTILLMCKKFPISNDSQVGSIYEEIGRIYQEDKKLKLALTFYHKAADIYYWCYSQTSNHNINIQKLIQDNINQMKKQNTAFIEEEYKYEPAQLEDFLPRQLLDRLLQQIDQKPLQQNNFSRIHTKISGQEKSPQADEKSVQQNELTTIDENLEQHDKVSEFDEKPAQHVKLPQVDEKSAEHDELIPIDEKPAEHDELSTIGENLEQQHKSGVDGKSAQYAILPQLDEKPVKRDELPLNNEKPANHGKFQPPGVCPEKYAEILHLPQKRKGNYTITPYGNVITLTEIEVFTATIYAEARGEPYEAQTWVAWVIKNRALLNRSYWGGNTIKGVCLQPGQFECWNDRSNIEINEPEAYARISQLANDIFYANQSQDPTGGANHYNHPAKEGYPPWTQNCLRLRKIGNYQFYKSL